MQQASCLSLRWGYGRKVIEFKNLHDRWPSPLSFRGEQRPAPATPLRSREIPVGEIFSDFVVADAGL